MFFSGTCKQSSTLRWTCQKTDLYELLVALDRHSAFCDKSGHRAAFTTVLEEFSAFFGMEFTDASTVKKNILERKSSRSAFIDALRLSLLTDR